MSPAASIQDISLLRDQASTAKRLLRKRHLSLESQNEAAKLHLAASLRMGDWLRNRAVKAEGGQPYQNSTGRNLGLVENKPETYTSLGIDKRDASKMQRLWDWLRNCHEKAEGTRGIIQDGMDGVGGPVLRPPTESDPPETYAFRLRRAGGLQFIHQCGAIDS